MTPQELKNSILQLAIQGKLVEQRSEEGTAEELYRQIQKEKQALIKAGLLKKTKPLPVITEDMFPYELPANWKICYVDDIAFVTKLAGFEYTEYVAPNLKLEGIPIFKGKNVQNGKVVLDFESFIPQSISDELPRSQIRKKCLLTPYVGTIGNIAIFDGSFRAHLGSNVGKIELLNEKEEHISEEYVLYYMRSQYGYAELTKFKKATAQESISIEAIRNVIIPLPPLAEQKRIVAKIEELLPYIDRYEKAWNRLEDFNKRFPADMQKSILQLAIQGKLVEQRPEEGTGEDLYQQIQKEKQALIKTGKIKKGKTLPEITENEMEYDIPGSWKAVRLGDVISLLSGTDFKPEEYNEQKRGIPYITGASSLSEKSVLLNRWTETPRIIAHKGDVLLVCKGSGYGKTVICDIEKAHIARQIMSIQYTDLLDMKYIMFFLNANLSLIKANGQGVIPGIDRGSVQTMVFPLPPLAEQKRIVAKLEELLPLCERLK